MKILIADDDPVALAMLESALRTTGSHEIATARDGAEASRAIIAHDFDVVIADWMMPDVNGLELCRRVREVRDRYIYFILLTGVTDSAENQLLAMDAGVDDFLRKPVDRFELAMRLRVARRFLAYTQRVQGLESILPICSYCKRIRDEHSQWKQLEVYIRQHTGTEFSHSICPECVERVVQPQLKAMRIAPPPKE